MGADIKNPIIFGNVQDKDMFFSDPITPIVESPVEPVKEEDEKPVETKTDPVFEEEKKPASPSDIFLDMDLEAPVDVKPPVEKKKTEEDNTNYADIVKALVKSGEWEEFVVDTEDGEININEVDELSFEDFKSLTQQQKKARIDQEKKAIDDDLSPDEKEFLEFKKQGGTMEAYIQTYNFRKQASEIAIETKPQQEGIINSYYKNMVGWDDKKIQRYLSKLTDEERLEEAENSKKSIEEYAKAKHAEILEERQKETQKIIQAREQYKEGLKTRLKESGLGTKDANTIIRAFTEPDKLGYTEADIAYIKLKNDPQKVEALYKFLTDPDGFIKEAAQTKVNENNLEVFKKFKLKKGNSPEDLSPKKREGGKNRSELIINIPD